MVLFKAQYAVFKVSPNYYNSLDLQQYSGIRTSTEHIW